MYNSGGWVVVVAVVVRVAMACGCGGGDEVDGEEVMMKVGVGGVEMVVMGCGLWWWYVVEMMISGCSWWYGVDGDDVAVMVVVAGAWSDGTGGCQKS
ncbi:hypothetical protein Tco_1004182 [Tanacetum coccineum]|uniref:Uncharacterized protein n=1 Tax=Tanacetum coccineum TaxID=301880 RepID=A0ABQ5FCA1_9ASTR